MFFGVFFLFFWICLVSGRPLPPSGLENEEEHVTIPHSGEDVSEDTAQDRGLLRIRRSLASQFEELSERFSYIPRSVIIGTPFLMLFLALLCCYTICMDPPET